MSKEAASAAVSGRILMMIALQLLPAVAATACIVYTKVASDRGPWWFLAALFSILAAMGLVWSVVTLVLAAVFKKISRGHVIADLIILLWASVGGAHFVAFETPILFEVR